MEVIATIHPIHPEGGGNKSRIEGGETRQPQQGTGVWCLRQGDSQSEPHFNWPPPPCFLWRGNHRVYECPKKASLQAFQAALDADSDPKSKGEEVEKALNIETPQMGALKFLFAVQKKIGEQKEPIEKDLLYVEA